MGSLLLCFVVASMLVLQSETAQAQNSQLEESCRGEITKKLREWSVTSVTADVAECLRNIAEKEVQLSWNNPPPDRCKPSDPAECSCASFVDA
jgi:hypothetical protein